MVVGDHSPSAETPALSHFFSSRSIRRSAIRCSRNFISHSWLMLSKKPRMSASMIQFTFRLVIPTYRASRARCWLRPGRKP